MTDAQFRVLELLEKLPRVASRSTHHGYVSGSCALALSRDGYAKRLWKWQGDFDEDRWQITSAGMLALIDERNRRAGMEAIRAALAHTTTDTGGSDPNTER